MSASCLRWQILRCWQYLPPVPRRCGAQNRHRYSWRGSSGHQTVRTTIGHLRSHLRSGGATCFLLGGRLDGTFFLSFFLSQFVLLKIASHIFLHEKVECYWEVLEWWLNERNLSWFLKLNSNVLLNNIKKHKFQRILQEEDAASDGCRKTLGMSCTCAIQVWLVGYMFPKCSWSMRKRMVVLWGSMCWILTLSQCIT